MTDQHQPTPAELEELKTQVVTEVAELGIDPRGKLDEVSAHIKKLYQLMQQSGQDTQPLYDAWEGIRIIAAAGDTTAEIAAHTRSLANHLKQQLDLTKLDLKDAITERQELQSDYSSTLSELDELQGAIYDLDQQHPVVSEAFDAMRDEVASDFWESGAYISYDPAQDIKENLIDIDYVQAGMFHKLLVADDDNELTGAAQAELAAFIKDFVERHSIRYQKMMDDLAQLNREAGES